MKTMKRIKILNIGFLLLLPFHSLLLDNRFIPTVQGQSAARLEGSSWQGNTEFDLNTGDIMNIEFTYIFSKNRKVELAFLAFISGLEYQNTNNNTIQPVFNPLKSTFSGTEVCIYELAGKSIQIKCPTTGNVNATINGSRMKGEIASKLKGVNSKKETWIIERRLTESNSSSPSAPRNSPETPKAQNPTPKPSSDKKYDQLVSHNAESMRSFLLRAEAKMEMGDYRGAIHDFDRVEQLASKRIGAPTQIYWQRGNAKFELQNYQGALADYNQFFKRSDITEIKRNLDTLTKPRLANILNRRAVSKLKLGDMTGACEDFRESCEVGNGDFCATFKNICNVKQR